MLGLLSDLPGKNCWTVAERAGDAGPEGMQLLLREAVWDADAVRDDIRALVVEHLGTAEAVLVVDETGDVRKTCTPLVCNGSSPGPWVGSRMPRSGCS
jgi:SRSO17 transposase